MLALELAAVALLIVLNGFFAMAELALVSARWPSRSNPRSFTPPVTTSPASFPVDKRPSEEHRRAGEQRPTGVSRLIGSVAVALFIASRADADQLVGRLGPLRLLGDGPHRLLIGAGVFDAFAESRYDIDGDRSPATNLDLRLGRKLLGVGPAIGVTANVNGGVFGYAGLYADLAIASFVVTPLVGAGAYRRGDSKDLGGTFAVRVELGVAHEFANKARLGIRWGHVSNAYTYEQNPTEEEYLITYARPF